MKLLHIPLLATIALSSTYNPPTKPLTPEKALTYAKTNSTGNNQLSADLLNFYINSPAQKDKNIFFSPFSISSALSMTGEGAKKTTREEMLKTLHLSTSDSLRQYGFLGMNQLLNNPKAAYKLNTSNSLWISNKEKLHPDFLRCAREYYGATAETINFDDAENACKTINLFVENKTEKRIRNILTPSLINPLTRLILVNTIYFKADWKNAFKVANTEEKAFTTSAGKEVKAKIMQQTNHFNYSETADLQAIEMPYAGDEMSMIVILPKNGKTVPSMDAGKLSALLAGRFRNEKVIVSFPKFKFETSYKMKADLSALGMPLAFSDLADFSGISTINQLKISEVIHKAFVEVEEKGTEAAAATVVVMQIETSVHFENPPVVFNANHPFIFMIRHNSSGAILFTGVVNNPTE